MSKLNSAFSNSQSLRVKSFSLEGYPFKVRIPLAKEMEDLQTRIEQVSDDQMEARFKKMAASLEGVDGVEVTPEDVTVDGRSVRELAKTSIIMENRILEFIKFLIPENGTLDDLTYADVEAEWPTQVQMALVDKITEVIQPNYREAKKN